MEYFNRYAKFNVDGKNKIVPFIQLNVKASDKTVVFKKGKDRFDILSNLYYNNPTYGWLIMLANPKYGGMEDEVTDRDIIRIPYPLKPSLQEYLEKVKTHFDIYGT